MNAKQRRKFKRKYPFTVTFDHGSEVEIFDWCDETFGSGFNYRFVRGNDGYYRNTFYFDTEDKQIMCLLRWSGQ